MQSNQKTTFVQEHTKLRLIFSKLCETKVRALCNLLPNNEWSGAAFYTYIKENGNIVLKVEDFCLQDIGSGVYTEYDMNGDTASYYAEHIDSLLGCKIATLHSHNKMSCFFSSTDVSTLHEASSQMNNVLSIIVNNAGSYVAKFTQKEEVHHDILNVQTTKEISTMSYMGDENKSNSSIYHTSNRTADDFTRILCYDCEIEKPAIDSATQEYKSIEEQYKVEVANIIAAKEEEKKSKITANATNIASQYMYPYYMDKDNNSHTIGELLQSIYNLSFNIYSFVHSTDDNVAAYNPYLLKKHGSYIFWVAFIDAWQDFFNPSVQQIDHVYNAIMSDKRIDDTEKNNLLLVLSDVIWDLEESNTEEANIFGNNNIQNINTTE
jgi:proteasome lid subunit RPN8/RPN11